MRDTPRIGTVKDSGKWHFGREDNFCIETFCGERFIPCNIGWAFENWIAEDIQAMNACDQCKRLWTERNTEVTELNSMFNLPDARLAPAGPNVSFSDWLVESDAQAGHLDTIQFTI